MEKNQFSETRIPDDIQGGKVIPVIEEQVVVGTKRVEKASILIEKKIKTEEVSVDVPLTGQSYDIQRIPKNDYLESIPEIWHEGDTTVIPVVKEVMVKKILLTEEIRITKKIQVTEGTENVSLKKEEVTITRKENDVADK
jgi:stress response protein YsnF